MKATLIEVNALPIDRLNLSMLPDGVLDVEIRLYADQEAFQHLIEYFRAQHYKGTPVLEARPNR